MGNNNSGNGMSDKEIAAQCAATEKEIKRLAKELEALMKAASKQK